MNIDINDIRSVVTVLSFGLFAVIAAWAWLPRNRSRFEEDAELVFLDDPTSREGSPS